MTQRETMLSLLKATNGGPVSEDLICMVIWGGHARAPGTWRKDIQVLRYWIETTLEVSIQRYRLGTFVGYFLNV